MVFSGFNFHVVFSLARLPCGIYCFRMFWALSASLPNQHCLPSEGHDEDDQYDSDLQ